MNETKILTGGMDGDNAIEHIQPTDFITAHNYRPTGTDSQDAGYGNNIESTVEIESVLPSGITKTIGSKAFETLRKIYEVKYNSNGNHQFVEIDFDSKQEKVLFENKTNTNGKDLLNLNPQSYINDMRLVQDRWIIMTDGFGEVYNLDLQLLRQGYGRPIIPSDIFLVKEMPLTVPQVEYGDDSNYSVNNLRGKLFQFRTQLKYNGNMFSAYSPISKRPTPSNEGSSTLGQTVTKDNYIKVEVKLGDVATERLIIAMRYNENNSWVIVKDLDVKYIKGLADTSLNISGGIKESYNPLTSTYTFAFYNDGSYTPIDVNDTDLPYDAVPQTANTVEVVNGNIIALGGIKEGYERPTNVDVSVSTSNYKINIGTQITGGGNFDVVGTSIRRYAVQGRFEYLNHIVFSGTPTVGDIIKVVLVQESNTSLTSTALNHTVTSSEALDKQLLFQNLANEITGGQVVKSVKTTQGVTFYTRPDIAPYKIKSATIDLVNIGVLDTKSYNVLKSGSMYQTALAYYDKYGRYFPIVTDDRFKVQTTPIAESEGLTPQINWTINSKPPVGAVAYEWLVTENLKMLNYVTLTAKYDPARSATGDYLVFEVPSLQRFIDANKGVISYQFTEGDRATFIKTTDGNTEQAIKWFKFPAVEVDVISFDTEVVEITADEVETKYFLKVRKSSNLNVSDVDGKEVEIELYSPRPIGDAKTSLFYGVGEVYPIINNEHSVLSGTIREGDAYLKGRIYESTIVDDKAVAYVVEDANFSDSYKSKYYSYGRARSYYDEVGQVSRKGSIRFSDVSVLGGQYNGLNRFYLGRIYGEGAGETTSKYGAITKLQMRDSYLIVIHELKVGHIPVYLTIVEDNEGNIQVADSAKLFGTVRYMQGNFGTGTAINSVSVSKIGNVYFVDDNNNVVVRDGYDGVKVINGNMNKWFNERIKKSKGNGDRIISYYNDFYDELNITFLTTEGEVYQFDFNEDTWKYKDTFNVLPNQITISNVTNGTASYNNITGELTFTPNLNFVGMAEFDVNFQGNVKHVCIDYTSGNSTPQPFSFADKVGVAQGVWVESNIVSISGTNMPSIVSVVGGEFRINGGAWLTTSGTMNPTDTIQLRVMSSPDLNTDKSMSVTIGGVVGTFKTTTLDTVITGDIEARVTITNLGGTGQYNEYEFEVRLTEPITVPFNFNYMIYYMRGNQYTRKPVLGTITAGQTIYSELAINDADPSDNLVTYELRDSTPNNGDLVTKFGTTEEYMFKISSEGSN